MKNLRTIPILALVAIMVASVAQAAPTVSIFFSMDDGEETWDDTMMHEGQRRDIHVVLSGFDASVNAVEYKINLPAELGVIGTEYAFAGALDLGTGHASSGTGTAVGFGECYPLYQVTNGTADLVVQKLTVYSFGSIARQEITVTAFEGGGDSPTEPRYSLCDGTLEDLASESAWIEVTAAVPSDANSWGAIKSLY